MPSHEDKPRQSPAARPSTPRPVGVVIIAAVLAAESVALLAAAVWYVVGLVTSPVVSWGGSVFMVVLLLALAAGLAAVAINVYRGYRWTRSAAFVWQLLMLSIAVPTLLGGQLPVGLALLVPPLAVIVLLFSPSVVAFTLRTGGGQAVL